MRKEVIEEQVVESGSEIIRHSMLPDGRLFLHMRLPDGSVVLKLGNAVIDPPTCEFGPMRVRATKIHPDKGLFVHYRCQRHDHLCVNGGQVIYANRVMNKFGQEYSLCSDGDINPLIARVGRVDQVFAHGRFTRIRDGYIRRAALVDGLKPLAVTSRHSKGDWFIQLEEGDNVKEYGPFPRRRRQHFRLVDTGIGEDGPVVVTWRSGRTNDLHGYAYGVDYHEGYSRVDFLGFIGDQPVLMVTTEIEPRDLQSQIVIGHQHSEFYQWPIARVVDEPLGYVQICYKRDGRVIVERLYPS